MSTTERFESVISGSRFALDIRTEGSGGVRHAFPTPNFGISISERAKMLFEIPTTQLMIRDTRNDPSYSDLAHRVIGVLIHHHCFECMFYCLRTAVRERANRSDLTGCLKFFWMNWMAWWLGICSAKGTGKKFPIFLEENIIVEVSFIYGKWKASDVAIRNVVAVGAHEARS